MATTLAEARGLLRRKLEDTALSPLWADQLLDDGLAVALIEYGRFRPAEQAATVTLAEGDVTFTLPADCRRLVRVSGPDGWIYPPATEGVGRTSDLQAMWETFADEGSFTAAVPAGDYTLWYLADWVFPASDAASFPIADGEISLLVALAVVYVLDERAVAEWKRGPLAPRYATVLQQAQAAAAREWAGRRRRVRVGATGGT